MNAVSIRLFFVVLLIGVNNAELNSTFYNSTCPNLLKTIKKVVETAVANEKRMAASLLRLHFHDCFVQGCDASILLKNGENNAFTNNKSVRGFEIIDAIKTEVEKLCAGIVSCADILAVAARDSVVLVGGPHWEVPLGRRDTNKSASVSDVNINIPSPALNLNGLIASFANKGLNASEMVALSGAHTIGEARCTNFRGRIYNETNINPGFASNKRLICPFTGGDNNLTGLDSTSKKFDNRYFTDLINSRGLLSSDQELFTTTASNVSILVQNYSTNESMFFKDFASAMIKMSRLSPLEGSEGEIRKNCSKTN